MMCSLVNGHFSRWTGVSWCLLKQMMMVLVVTTGAMVVSCARLQSYHHHQQTNTQYNVPIMCWWGC